MDLGTVFLLVAVILCGLAAIMGRSIAWAGVAFFAGAFLVEKL